MKRRRMPRPLGPALERVADGVMPKTVLAEVQRVWPQAVGPAVVASGAEPTREADGVVTVDCGSAVWADQLNLMSERIVATLNEHLGRPAVRALRTRATGPRH